MAAAEEAVAHLQVQMQETHTKWLAMVQERNEELSELKAKMQVRRPRHRTGIDGACCRHRDWRVGTGRTNQ